MMCRLCGLWVEYLVDCHELKACPSAVCNEDAMMTVRRSWINALLSNRRSLVKHGNVKKQAGRRRIS
jgi:hypothetical protein